jgi:hypothetical protein
VSSDEPQTTTEISVDTSNLYREEIYTDLKVASVRRLIPVKADGSPDETREPLFSGQTTIMTGGGMLPVNFALDASNLEEALAKFPDAVREAVDRLVEEAREIQRREASRIVVPGQVPIPGPLGGSGEGGGGGKFGIS